MANRKENDENTLEWGKITIENLLRQLYKDKNLTDMSDEEVNSMLEDLI